MTTEEIKTMLDLHELWLKDKPEGKRADLCGANLSRANLSRANLRLADLSRANLSEADLSRANLSEADLSGANLREADLNEANLNWQSHDLMAELLMRAAGQEVSMRKIAGLVLISRDWCWSKFEVLLRDDPEPAAWVRSVLWPLGTEKSPAPPCFQPLD